jgi:hypothetical protein
MSGEEMSMKRRVHTDLRKNRVSGALQRGKDGLDVGGRCSFLDEVAIGSWAGGHKGRGEKEKGCEAECEHGDLDGV